MSDDPTVTVWVEAVKVGAKVLIYIATLAAAWGSLDAQVDGLKNRLDRHENRMETRFNQLESRINDRLTNGE